MTGRDTRSNRRRAGSHQRAFPNACCDPFAAHTSAATKKTAPRMQINAKQCKYGAVQSKHRKPGFVLILSHTQSDSSSTALQRADNPGMGVACCHLHGLFSPFGLSSPKHSLVSRTKTPCLDSSVQSASLHGQKRAQEDQHSLGHLMQTSVIRDAPCVPPGSGRRWYSCPCTPHVPPLWCL